MFEVCEFTQWKKHGGVRIYKVEFGILVVVVMETWWSVVTAFSHEWSFFDFFCECELIERMRLVVSSPMERRVEGSDKGWGWLC